MKLTALRIRVTAWYVGLLAAALIVFGASLYLGLERYLDNSLQHSLSSDAQSISESFVAQFEPKGVKWLIDEVGESYAPESGGRFVRISRSNGEVLFQSGDTRDQNIIASGISPPPVSRSQPGLRRERQDGNRTVEIYSLPYTSPAGGKYIIETGASLKPMERLLGSLLVTLLILTPLVLLIAAVGGYVLMVQPLKPIESLTVMAERIGTGDLGERFPIIASGDELERLSLALNSMIGRLEDALAHNRRFSEDVSHELRTPLTILRGELEHVIQLRSLEPGVTDAVGSALEETERMSRIVESLLEISRLNSGLSGIALKSFDLQQLAATTTEQMRLLGEERKITLRCIAGPAVMTVGDESRLKQVLVNLLDNAIKYTGAAGHVDVATRVQNGFAVLEVSDDGIGITAESLPHVFDRFYRAEKARSRGSAGAGLGLSIVRAICRAHEGAVSIVSSEGKGTTVTVQLPLASAAGDAPGMLPPGLATSRAKSRDEISVAVETVRDH